MSHVIWNIAYSIYIDLEKLSRERSRGQEQGIFLPWGPGWGAITQHGIPVDIPCVSERRESLPLYLQIIRNAISPSNLRCLPTRLAQYSLRPKISSHLRWRETTSATAKLAYYSYKKKDLASSTSTTVITVTACTAVMIGVPVHK